MASRMFLVGAAMLALASCSRVDAPQQAAAGGDPAADEPAERSAPAAASPSMEVRSHGEPVNGRVEAEGPAVGAPGRLGLRDGSVELRYVLPEGLTEPSLPESPLHIAARNRQGPGGTSRLVVASAGEDLLLATTWMSGTAPIRVSFPGGLVLRQQRTDPTATSGYVEAPVGASGPGLEEQTLRSGAVTRISLDSGEFDVAVLVSHYLADDDPTQGSQRYTLHLWVTPAS